MAVGTLMIDWSKMPSDVKGKEDYLKAVYVLLQEHQVQLELKEKQLEEREYALSKKKMKSSHGHRKSNGGSGAMISSPSSPKTAPFNPFPPNVSPIAF